MNNCVIVRNTLVGYKNNNGLIEFLPQYSELMSILYDLGTYVPGPESGTINEFYLPETSKSEFIGTSTGKGFATFTPVQESLPVEREDPFYTTDEGYIIQTLYSDLDTTITWSSDKEIEIIFMSPCINRDSSRLYPMISNNNSLMIQKGKEGNFKTRDYDGNIFVHVSCKCMLRVNLIVGNPLELHIPILKEGVKIPVTMQLGSSIVPVAYSLLKSSGYVKYEAYPEFIDIVDLVNRKAEYYSLHNPLLSVPTNSLRVEYLNKIVVLQNIRLYRQKLRPNSFFSRVDTVGNDITFGMKDQYGNISKYITGSYSIGEYSKLYDSVTHYPIVHCTLCVPSSSNMEGSLKNVQLVNIRSAIKWDLLDNGFQKLNIEEVKMKTSVNTKYRIWCASFLLAYTAAISPKFAIKFNNRAGVDLKDAKWMVKITFANNTTGIPTLEDWDPFKEIVVLKTQGDGEIKPPSYEYTVANVLLVGGGGGGSGSIASSGMTVGLISGGGGGRGSVTELTGIEANTFEYSVGKAGVNGPNNNVLSLRGIEGESTTIKYNGIVKIAEGGQGSNSINGGNSGGGSGSKSIYDGISYTRVSGIPGDAGQGKPGNAPGGSVGGKGGDGPKVSFTGVTTGEGKNGSVSDTPAGGGAGCVIINNVEYGYGGNGATQITGDKATPGGGGCVLVEYRYVAF
jgi:hypothetical protein